MTAGQANKPFGFTLIELLVSLAVLVVIVTLAVPSYQGMAERERGVTAANSALSAIRHARSFAITHRVDGVSVQLGGDQGWPITVFDPREDPPEEAFRRNRNHASVSLSWAGDGNLEFGIFGRPTDADTICIFVSGVAVHEVEVGAGGNTIIRGEEDLEDC